MCQSGRVGGCEIMLWATLRSMFVRRMQAYCQGLWVLCAEVSKAWHVLGVGAVLDLFYSPSLLQCRDRVLKVKPYGTERATLGHG